MHGSFGRKRLIWWRCRWVHPLVNGDWRSAGRTGRDGNFPYAAEPSRTVVIRLDRCSGVGSRWLEVGRHNWRRRDWLWRLGRNLCAVLRERQQRLDPAVAHAHLAFGFVDAQHLDAIDDFPDGEHLGAGRAFLLLDVEQRPLLLEDRADAGEFQARRGLCYWLRRRFHHGRLQLEWIAPDDDRVSSAARIQRYCGGI